MVETLHRNVLKSVYNEIKSVYKVEILYRNVFTSIVGVVKSIVGVVLSVYKVETLQYNVFTSIVRAVPNDSLDAKKKNSLTKS